MEKFGEEDLKGQKQKWFVVKFLGSDGEINLQTDKPEFIEWRWIDIEYLPNVIVDFKKKFTNSFCQNKKFYKLICDKQSILWEIIYRFLSSIFSWFNSFFAVFNHDLK